VDGFRGSSLPRPGAGNGRLGSADRRKEDALSKRRAGELVPRAREQTDDVLAARAINAEPSEPLAGMIKRQCPWCRYFFAAPPAPEELRCPDCVSFDQRSKHG